jgi:lipid-A-disaccharide synthase
MGIVEIILHLPKILRRIRQTADDVLMRRPVALITIDSPDFCFRVAKKLKGCGIPLVHYVAPSVWAWRPERAKKIAGFLDHLLALLPFEPPYFTKEGLPCTFVGHPLVESGASSGDGERFIKKYNVGKKATLLMLLPGSRAGEIKRLLPVFYRTVMLLATHYPNLEIVVPTVPHVAALVEHKVKKWPVTVHFTYTDEDKYDAMAAARAALACSGTVSVELAMAKLPSVIAYKANALTIFFARRLIKTRFVTLINIMKNRAVMPEFLQENCTPDKLGAALREVMDNSVIRTKQVGDLSSISAWLGSGQFIPSEKAAMTVWRVAFSTQRKKL